MKKAVITILGIQNPKHSDDGIPRIQNYEHQARYYFENSKEVNRFYNTLPLLIEKFADYEIVPIYTKEAKIFNQEVLENANLNCNFNDEISLLEDEQNYLNIFSKIDNCINSFDNVIVDLTHGFRHLPILTIIDLVIQNFKSNNKIEKILFAKEIVKHTNIQTGEYEIVDLKEYLDIASISYVLSSFESNYTVLNSITISDKNFKELIKSLEEFSEHIMSNSLITLLREENSLIDEIIQNIENNMKDKNIEPLKHYLEAIKKHLEEINSFKELDMYIQLFEISKIMNKKGYFLNSITLLNEALSWYCAYNLQKYNQSFEQKYKTISPKNTYDTISFAKKIVRSHPTDRRHTVTKEKDKKIAQNVWQKLDQIPNIDNFSKFISSIDALRNNLAHANSGKKLDDIKEELQKLFIKFHTYCIQNNIMQNNLCTQPK